MIRTARLTLVEAPDEALRAGADDDRGVLGRIVGAEVSPDWPPEFLDRGAWEWLLRDREKPAGERTRFWLIVLEPGESGARRRLVIGTVGTKGGPDASGAIEVGYGIVASRQRQGYAPEAARGVIEMLFKDPRVNRVDAETLPELRGSIRVMEKCGMTFMGEGREGPGVIRYGVSRAAWDAR